MGLSAGTRLGPYEIRAPLGVGGMGEVYRARDSRLDRDVAIKILPEMLAQDPRALARFEREAKAVAALSHPNILAIHDFGVEGNLHFVVTELLEGETLRSRLTASGLSPRKAVEIAAALAEGLAAAHAKGIVHRDLKPENIFLTVDGRVKILDFGLARRVEEAADPEATQGDGVTEPGAVMGTAGYMSPEQVRGEKAEAPSDIFALGSVLYEMVSGKRAFSRANPVETMSAILREEPEALSDTQLQRVVARCLEKRPGERFQSARDLAFAVRQASTPVQTPQAGMPVLPALDSIAVLPFANASGDPDAEYLSDGIAESIINSLTRLGQLRVIPRSTMFRYKGSDADPQAVGRELGVRAVLTGRVLLRGETLIVSAELIDVAAQAQLWGERYNRKLADIFAVEEEIARQISENLRVKLSGEEKKRLAKRPTDNPEAYQLYLKGRYYWAKRTPEMMRRGMEHFERAIQTDPTYALAYAGLADCYGVLAAYNEAPPRDGKQRYLALARKSVELDPELPETHVSLAFAVWHFDWDWTAAEREFQRAFDLDPNCVQAHDWYGFYLASVGRFDDSIREIRRAKQLDPLSLLVHAHELTYLWLARRPEEAVALGHKALEMDPNYFQIHYFLGVAYEQKRMLEEAIRELRKAAELVAHNPIGVSGLAHALGLAGQTAEARGLLEQMLAEARSRYVDPYFLATGWIGLGEPEEAFRCLARAFEDHSLYLTLMLKVDSRLDPLRADPRFDELLRRVGYPQR